MPEYLEFLKNKAFQHFDETLSSIMDAIEKNTRTVEMEQDIAVSFEYVFLIYDYLQSLNAYRHAEYDTPEYDLFEAVHSLYFEIDEAQRKAVEPYYQYFVHGKGKNLKVKDR